MKFNRPYAKQMAKQRIKQNAVPSILLVTLVYLLLTSLLPSLASLTYLPSLNNVVTLAEEAMIAGNEQALLDAYSSLFQGRLGTTALFISILMTLFSLVVSAGYTRYSMKIARNQPDAGFQDLSAGLEIIGKVILLGVLMALYIYLWSLLFVIPGLIAAYRYRLAFYVLLDDPSISASEAIRRSKQMMNGRKGELFVLDLSFIGWMFVVEILSTLGSEAVTFAGDLLGLGSSTVVSGLSVLVSFGMYLILGLWLTAYRNITEVYFYDFVRGEFLNPTHAAPDYQGGTGNPPSGYDSGNAQIPYDNQSSGTSDEGQNDRPKSDYPDDPWN